MKANPIKLKVIKILNNFHLMELNYFIFAVAFRMYDLDGDDRISKEELLAVLTMMVGDNITEEQLNSIAERTIMEADDDKDGFISFDDFCKVLERTDVEQKMSIRFLSWRKNNKKQLLLQLVISMRNESSDLIFSNFWLIW